jgi:(p)ppGpp synthase/HD superfamily hydrolase
MEPSMPRRADELIERAYAEAQDDAGLVHARAVGGLLAEVGCEEHVVAAGLLHDVVEDTGVTVGQIRREFGPRVAELVDALTEDASIDDLRARKGELRCAIARAGHTALVIFAADKLERVRAADTSGTPIDPAKLEHYRRSSEMLAAHGVRTPHAQELTRRLRDGRAPDPALLAG